MGRKIFVKYFFGKLDLSRDFYGYSKLMFLILVFYHLMLSGNFYGWQIRHEIFWELNFGRGIFCAFDFCPHSIIPVTLTGIRAFHNLLEIFR